MIKTISNLLAIAGLAISLTACNTTRGIGQDVEAVGETIEETAEKAKRSLSDDE